MEPGLGSGLDARGASLTNKVGPAVWADFVHVEGDLILDDVEAVGVGDDGCMRLVGAQVEGVLDARKADLRNDSGPALYAARLEVAHHASFVSLCALGSGGSGAVNLIGADISGNCDFTDADLVGMDGPALDADLIEVGMDFLGDRMRVQAAGARGAVRLRQGRFRGLIRTVGATVENPSGPAVVATSIQVEYELALQHVTASGKQAGYGTIELSGGRIGGNLLLEAGAVRNTAGPGVSGDNLTV